LIVSRARTTPSAGVQTTGVPPVPVDVPVPVDAAVDVAVLVLPPPVPVAELVAVDDVPPVPELALPVVSVPPQP